MSKTYNIIFDIIADHDDFRDLFRFNSKYQKAEFNRDPMFNRVAPHILINDDASQLVRKTDLFQIKDYFLNIHLINVSINALEEIITIISLRNEYNSEVNKNL